MDAFSCLAKNKINFMIIFFCTGSCLICTNMYAIYKHITSYMSDSKHYF